MGFNAVKNKAENEKKVVITLAATLIFLALLCSAYADDFTYYNVGDVFHNFTWYGNNIKLQLKLCGQSNCSDGMYTGPDNTSTAWFDNPTFNNISLTNISVNRYMQYKAYLFRNITEGQSYSPELYNVSYEILKNGSISQQLTLAAWVYIRNAGVQSPVMCKWNDTNNAPF